MNKDMLSFCIPHFSKRYCLGDGNCLFRAFSDQLYQTELFWAYIRQIVVELLKIYRDEFSNFIDESDSPNADFDSYLQKVATSGEWSGDLEIRALSLLYQMPVEIFDSNLKKIKTFYDDHNSKSKQLVFRILWEHNPGHFSSIVKKGRKGIFPLSNNKFPGHLEARGLFKAMNDKNIPNAVSKIKSIHNQLCQDLDIPQVELDDDIFNLNDVQFLENALTVDTKFSSDESDTNNQNNSNIPSSNTIVMYYTDTPKSFIKFLPFLNKIRSFG